MATEKFQAMIDQTNKRTQAQRGRQFAKKATDSQMLVTLHDAGAAAVRAYYGHVEARSVETLAVLKTTMAELKRVCGIVERREK